MDWVTPAPIDASEGKVKDICVIAHGRREEAEEDSLSVSNLRDRNSKKKDHSVSTTQQPRTEYMILTTHLKTQKYIMNPMYSTLQICWH